MDKQTLKKEKRKIRISTIEGYVCLILVLLAVLPVVLPRIFGYHTYVCGADTTGKIFKYGSVVYTKEIDNDSFEEGNIAAVKSNSGKYLKADTYYVDASGNNTLKLRNGSSASYEEVLGHVVAQTPGIGYLCQFCYSAVGVVLIIAVLVAGIALMMYANKLGREVTKTLKEHEAQR